MEVSGAKSWHNLDCAAYLEDHAAWMDGCLSDAEAAEHEAHARLCDSCTRYTRVLSRGLQLVRELPEIEPSAHFEERLQHRIFHIDDERSQRRSSSRSVTGLAAAALIAAITWSPMFWGSHATSSSRSAANLSTPAGANAMMQASAASQLAANEGWYAEPSAAEIEQMPVHRFVGYEGSYSPLIVSPPTFVHGPRAVRLMAANSK